MTNEEAIEVLKILPKFIDWSITSQGENIEQAISLAIKALNLYPLALHYLENETQKDDDLCETCRYGDTCGQSDKGVPFAKHTKCWKYEMKEADNDKVN